MRHIKGKFVAIMRYYLKITRTSSISLLMLAECWPKQRVSEMLNIQVHRTSDQCFRTIKISSYGSNIERPQPKIL